MNIQLFSSSLEYCVVGIDYDWFLELHNTTCEHLDYLFVTCTNVLCCVIVISYTAEVAFSQRDVTGCVAEKLSK